MPADRMFILVAVGILIVGGYTAMSHANAEATPGTTVTNETWTPNTGTFVELDNSRLNQTFYDANVTVYNSTDAEMTAGADYVWDDSFEEGTIKAVTGGNLDGEPNATVTYTYHEPSNTQRGVIQIVGYTEYITPWLLYAIIVGLVLGAAKVMA